MYPVLLMLGPVALRTAGMIAIGAVIVTSMLAAREIRHRGYPPALIYDAITPVLLAGLAGARLAYVLLFDPAWYLAHPGQAIAVWRGGLAEEGAFLGGLLVALWWCRRRGVAFWTWADAAAPGLALGQALMRIGALFSGTGYGTPTDRPWAVTFTNPYSSAPLGIPLHPTQLYEFLLDLGLFAALLRLGSRLEIAGERVLLLVMGSALIRLAIDGVKGDVIQVWGDITSGRVFGALALVGAGTVFVWRRTHREWVRS